MHFLRKLWNFLRRAPASSWKPYCDETVWKPYCDEIGGRYVKGGFWKGEDRIEITHQGWVITLVVELDDNGHRLTVLRAQVDLVSGVSLTLLRNWPGQCLAKLAVWMSGQEKVAVSGLSVDCLITAEDQLQAEAFFGDERLQNLIRQQPKVMVLIGMQHRFFRREDVFEVEVIVPVVVNDVPRLKSLVELSRKAIDTLSDTGLITTHGDAS